MAAEKQDKSKQKRYFYTVAIAVAMIFLLYVMYIRGLLPTLPFPPYPTYPTYPTTPYPTYTTPPITPPSGNATYLGVVFKAVHGSLYPP